MIISEIPIVQGAADQTQNITIGGIPFSMRFMWNERFQYWSLSVSERNGDALLTNIKMVHNYPLTNRFGRLGLAGDFYLIHATGADIRPDFDTFGTRFCLYYIDPETVEDLPMPLLPKGSIGAIWDQNLASVSLWDVVAGNPTSTWVS